MSLSQPYLLTLTLVLGMEYWLKQLWETISAKWSRPVLAYLVYRLIHLVLLSISGPLLFDNVHLQRWIAFSTIMVLLGSCEILVAVVHLLIQQLYGIRCRLLNYLIPISLIVLSTLNQSSPLINIDYTMIFLFVFLAHPANYLIRWFLSKDELTLADTAALSILQTETTGKFDHMAESAAAVLSEKGPGIKTLQAGRMIGTLERWLILMLLSSGNISGMGFVITAKSIVRYPRLNDPEFAEYYLLGTLSSVVLALLSGFLLLGGI